MLQNWVHRLLPNHCIFCDQSAQPARALCDDCQLDLPYQDPDHQCKQCGIALLSDEKLCSDCLYNPPDFSRAHIPFEYRSHLGEAIGQFKYRAQLTKGSLLADLLTEHLIAQQQNDDWEPPSVILPVPMHWERRWTRGFNHTEQMAARLAKKLNIPMKSTWLNRHPSNQLQKALNRHERGAHLLNSFQVSASAKISNQRIALVDDVVTTTATARELSRTLKLAGAAQIQLWALARTPSPTQSEK